LPQRGVLERYARPSDHARRLLPPDTHPGKMSRISLRSSGLLLSRSAHSLAVGIERPVIDAINARKTPSLADARERTCFAVARELLANKGFSDESYAAAEKAMGAHRASFSRSPARS
jgi:hypothetical protein